MPSVQDTNAKAKSKNKTEGSSLKARNSAKSPPAKSARKRSAVPSKPAHPAKGANGKLKTVAPAAAKPGKVKNAKASARLSVVVAPSKKKSSLVTKPSQSPAKPHSANGVGAKGILGKMDMNGHGASGKPAALKIKDSTGAKRAKKIILPPDYQPSEGEPFMNEMHRIYFKNKLLAWKEDILRQNLETLKGLHDESAQQADPADRATAETDRALELRARDRQRKLMGKIDSALARIEEGAYGYCEETGEPISLKRLDARPIATLSLEAQERRERRERVFRED